MSVTSDLLARIARISGSSPTVPSMEEHVQDVVRLRKALRPPEMVPPATPGSLKAFVDWLPADLSCVEFKRAPGSDGHGVYARRDLRRGELIMTIPYSLVLSPFHRSDVVQGWAGKSSVVRDESVQLALLLLHERRLGAESPFAPYIAILPEADLPPTKWDWEDIKLLQGNMSYLITMNRCLSITMFYGQLLESLGQEVVGSFGEFMWAMGVVLSRQNPVHSASNPNQVALGLVPGFDMFNHDPNLSEITTSQNPLTFDYEIRAPRDFLAGQQVTLFYGPRPDIELLVFSGFVAQPPGINRNTAVVIEFPVAKLDVKLERVKDAIIKGEKEVRVSKPDLLAISVGGRSFDDDHDDSRSLKLAAMIAAIETREDAADALRRKLAADASGKPALIVLTEKEKPIVETVLGKWMERQSRLLDKLTTTAGRTKLELAKSMILSEMEVVKRVVGRLS